MSFYNNPGRRSPFDEIIRFFKQKAILPRLILINLAIFLIINIFGNIPLWLFKADENVAGISKLLYYLAVPADTDLLLYRPWTLFTYMFLHENIFHIFFNMLILYFGGRIFLEYLNSKQLLTVYLWAGLFGAILFIISFNTFPRFLEDYPMAFALGASASVLGILIAVATYVPEYNVHLFFLGKIKLKYLALGIIVLDILNIKSGNPGGHIAHLGGALFGFVYIYSMKKESGWYKFFNLNWFMNYLKGYRGPRKSYSNQGPTKTRPVTDDEYNKQKINQQKKIDIILDKISKKGYDSLTKAEKEFLFRSSNKN